MTLSFTGRVQALETEVESLRRRTDLDPGSLGDVMQLELALGQNASVLEQLPKNCASAPVGLYWVLPGATLRRGDMAVAWPPAAARQLAARRRYLPLGVPLVKRVAGVAGDTICAADRTVLVDRKPVAVRRLADAAGRPLPAWRGCFTLGPGSVFLLMRESPDSFDGRYFGATSEREIVGKARALWLR